MAFATRKISDTPKPLLRADRACQSARRMGSSSVKEDVEAAASVVVVGGFVAEKKLTDIRVRKYKGFVREGL